MSLSNYREKATLEAIRSSGKWVQLHVGDPGETGTANKAKEGERKALTWTAPEETGAMTNVADIEWLEVETEGADDEYNFVSIWDASTAGNCEGSGALTAAVKVTSLQDFRIKAGKLKFEVG